MSNGRMAAVALFIATLLLGLPPLAMGRSLSVWVDGHPVSFDIPPLLVEGRVLVPVREFAQAMGARVDYHPSRRALRVVRGDRAREWALEEAVTLQGRALLPLRSLAEALGARVEWDASYHAARFDLE